MGLRSPKIYSQTIWKPRRENGVVPVGMQRPENLGSQYYVSLVQRQTSLTPKKKACCYSTSLKAGKD